MLQHFTPEQDQYLQLEKTKAYYQGMREGMIAYAWWSDGVQYVGTTGKTLESALAQVYDDEQKTLAKFQALI